MTNGGGRSVAVNGTAHPVQSASTAGCRAGAPLCLRGKRESSAAACVCVRVYLTATGRAQRR